MRKKFLASLSPNFLVFFEWCEEYLRINNKKLTIVNKKYITFDGGKCSGWCDGEEIVIAARSALFEETFVHEFAHMQQAIENDPCWDTDDKFWDDLKDDKLSINSWDSLFGIIALEHNCESRALKLSKKWNLFDNEIYAQRANLYLHFYHYVFLSKRWNSSSGLYQFADLIDRMPTKLVKLNSMRKIDMDIMQSFNKNFNHKKSKKTIPIPATLSKCKFLM